MSNHSDFQSKLKRPLEGFDRIEFDFGQALIERSMTYLSTAESGLWPAVVNRIIDGPGPKQMTSPIPAADAQLFKFWRAFLEISQSYESIRDVPNYLRHSPPKRIGVQHSRYMAWHVHGYLNEIYILQLRLKSFWSLVHKTYRSSVIAQSKQTATRIDKILKAFKSAVDARGSHVHESRLDGTEIDRLSVIENMSTFPWPAEVIPYFKIVRREVQKSWVVRMQENEPQIKLTLNSFFDTAHPILFTQDGRWVDP